MSVKDNKLDQIIKTVEENDIKFLKLQLSDIHGLPKSMAVPLKKADDAVELDTSPLTIPQVVEAMMKIINQKLGV